ncbi:hypothetical protein, partial [Xanthomonas arboricola]|uniref:hypothetical protein n=1 Tax=Xanthomonas arboricola TaxID=56448 RepID=UPI004040BD85
ASGEDAARSTNQAGGLDIRLHPRDADTLPPSVQRSRSFIGSSYLQDNAFVDRSLLPDRSTALL